MANGLNEHCRKPTAKTPGTKHSDQTGHAIDYEGIEIIGSNPREVQTFSSTILNISLGHIIASVHPTRITRVISSRLKREIVTAIELCQVT